MTALQIILGSWDSPNPYFHTRQYHKSYMTQCHLFCFKLLFYILS